MTDIRDAYFDTLLERMNHEPAKSMLLTVDMGARSLTLPHLTREANIINVGVSEQNAVTMAAGLSSRGVKTFVYGISAFLLNRARAQIRHDAVIGNNPVHLIGSGPGLSYDRDGPSHHSLDDIALMRTLPNTVILSPFDEMTAKLAVMCAFGETRTTYCRLDRGDFPDLHSEFHRYNNGLYSRFRDEDKWIICSGIKTHEALAEANKRDYSVASFFKIDDKSALELANTIPRGAKIGLMDETHVSGGLLQVVAEANLAYGQNMEWSLGQAQGLANKIVQEKMPRSKLYEAYSR